MSDDNPFADDAPVISGPPATATKAPATPTGADGKKVNAITQQITNITAMPIQKALRTLRLINALSGIIIIIIQVLHFVASFLNITDFNIAVILLNAYSIYFGIQMFLLELQLKRLGQNLRNNYGFLFTYLGRSIYIIFVATIILSTADLIGIILGVVILIVGLYNVLILFIHPAFKGGKMSIYDDPTVGYSSGENEISELLKKNPQLAQKALSATMKMASNTA